MKTVVTPKWAWKYVRFATSRMCGWSSANRCTEISLKKPNVCSTETTSRAWTKAVATSPVASIRLDSYARSTSANRKSWSRKSGQPFGRTRPRVRVRADAAMVVMSPNGTER